MVNDRGPSDQHDAQTAHDVLLRAHARDTQYRYGLAARLLQARLDQEMDLCDVAAEAGVSLDALEALEEGSGRLAESAEEWWSIAEAVGLTVGELLGGSEP